jgi:hypothetical protein
MHLNIHRTAQKLMNDLIETQTYHELLDKCYKILTIRRITLDEQNQPFVDKSQAFEIQSMWKNVIMLKNEIVVNGFKIEHIHTALLQLYHFLIYDRDSFPALDENARKQWIRDKMTVIHHRIVRLPYDEIENMLGMISLEAEATLAILQYFDTPNLIKAIAEHIPETTPVLKDIKKGIMGFLIPLEMIIKEKSAHIKGIDQGNVMTDISGLRSLAKTVFDHETVRKLLGGSKTARMQAAKTNNEDVQDTEDYEISLVVPMDERMDFVNKLLQLDPRKEKHEEYLTLVNIQDRQQFHEKCLEYLCKLATRDDATKAAKCGIRPYQFKNKGEPLELMRSIAKIEGVELPSHVERQLMQATTIDDFFKALNKYLASELRKAMSADTKGNCRLVDIVEKGMEKINQQLEDHDSAVPLIESILNGLLKLFDREKLISLIDTYTPALFYMLCLGTEVDVNMFKHVYAASTGVLLTGQIDPSYHQLIDQHVFDVMSVISNLLKNEKYRKMLCDVEVDYMYDFDIDMLEIAVDVLFRDLTKMTEMDTINEFLSGVLTKLGSHKNYMAIIRQWLRGALPRAQSFFKKYKIDDTFDAESSNMDPELKSIYHTHSLKYPILNIETYHALLKAAQNLNIARFKIIPDILKKTTMHLTSDALVRILIMEPPFKKVSDLIDLMKDAIYGKQVIDGVDVLSCKCSTSQTMKRFKSFLLNNNEGMIWKQEDGEHTYIWQRTNEKQWAYPKSVKGANTAMTLEDWCVNYMPQHEEDMPFILAYALKDNVVQYNVLCRLNESYSTYNYTLAVILFIYVAYNIMRLYEECPKGITLRYTCFNDSATKSFFDTISPCIIDIVSKEKEKTT